MSIQDDVRQFIVKNFYVADAAGLADDASLLDKGVIDSTGVLEVVAHLEEAYGIKVDDAELLPENLDSIARIAAFVQKKKG
ncbi:MAG: acyl carrier protein [Myxococcales bacterium]|jgi:acyl carrier protein|nr:acyl carrier protein [Myxococcales bacterium]HQY64013.1 acyl carrier protein [Polyangiaceae bacterium]